MSSGLLTEYLREFLLERLLPVDQELLAEMIDWYQKAYAAWFIINKLAPEMKKNKETIRKEIKSFEDKFFFFIDDSISDFYNLIDKEIWDIQDGKTKASKTYKKSYKETFKDDDHIDLEISLEEGTSILSVVIDFFGYGGSYPISKEFEFDARDKNNNIYMVSHMFAEYVSEETPGIISNNHEDNRYNYQDWQEDKEEWEEKRAGFEPKNKATGESNRLFDFEIDGVKSSIVASLVNGTPEDKMAHFSAAGEFGYIVVFAGHINKNINEMKNSIEHELRHAFQFRNSETGHFDQAKRGLPPRKIQTKHADEHGNPKKSDDNRIQHYLRDIEFQTNLGDMWNSIKHILSRWNDNPNLRDILFRALLEGSSRSDLDRIFQRYDLNYDEKQAIIYSFDMYIKKFWRLPALKKDSTGKWKAYIKMLYQLYQREFGI